MHLVAPQGADGRPVAAEARAFATDTGAPVQLVFGPGGELLVDLAAGTLERIAYTPGNAWPSAILDASATEGDLPLTVQFDGTRSSDGDGDTLTYAWDSTATAPTTTAARRSRRSSTRRPAPTTCGSGWPTRRVRRRPRP